MLKSQEIAQAMTDLCGEIETLKAEGKLTTEITDKLANLKAEYESQLVIEAEAKNAPARKETKVMDKNKIFKAILKNAVTEDMIKDLGGEGQVGVTPSRGGYLVPEEFLAVDEFGGEVRAIPARDIPVNLPTGKIPNFDLDQAKTNNKFLVAYDELDALGENTATFGQLTYTTVDKGGLVPVSNRLLEDAQSDVLGYVSQVFVTAAAYQRNADIISAIDAISGIKTEYAGASKTFEDVAGIKAIIKAIRGKLTGTNRANAVIVCCDSDFAKLACATNSQGDFYLRPMATDPARFMIDGVEVIAVDDAHFTQGSTVGGYLYAGNWNRVAYINRKGLEIATDASAGFAKDSVMVRGTKRACVKVLEDAAFVKVCEGVA